MPETVEMTDGGIVENTIALRLVIQGYYNTVEGLQAAHPTGEQFACYKVGDNLYIWSANSTAWVDMGPLRGKHGTDGDRGERGPVGLRGEVGPRGERGEPGIDGAKGAKGDIGGGTAFIDIWRVIYDSAPGKAGTAFIDNLVAGFHAEIKALAENTSTRHHTAQRGAELEAREKAARSHVNDRLLKTLAECASEWLQENKEGVTMILPLSNLFVAKQELDIGAPILSRLNLTSVDFTKEARAEKEATQARALEEKKRVEKEKRDAEKRALYEKRDAEELALYEKRDAEEGTLDKKHSAEERTLYEKHSAEERTLSPNISPGLLAMRQRHQGEMEALKAKYNAEMEALKAKYKSLHDAIWEGAPHSCLFGF